MEIKTNITKRDLPKLFTKIPKELREYYNNLAKNRNFTYTATMLQEYLEDYLNNPDKYSLPDDLILQYEQMPKEDRYFSFYYKRELEEKFKNLAKVNIRQPFEQGLHFLYALHYYLSRKGSI